MNSPSKSFSEVERDYRFFEACVDEIDRTLALWIPILKDFSSQRKKVRVLDFGCGTGSFTLRALHEWGLNPDSSEIVLLDPAESHVNEALESVRARGFADSRIVSTAAQLADDSIDVLLSHHVFYYVPDIEDVLANLKRSLAPGGIVLCAVSGDGTGAGQLQEEALATGGIVSPYRTGMDIAECFRQAFTDCRTRPYNIRIEMEDKLENRQSIMRFLVGEYRDSVDWEHCLTLFDPFSDGETIRVPSEELSIEVRTG